MKVAVTGSSGLIGSAVVTSLRQDGHDVVRLVRRETTASDEVSWDPRAGRVDRARLAGITAAVNLAGSPMARPWIPKYKSEIRSSRVDATRTIARALADLDPKPEVLLSASGAHAYGDTGDQEADELSPRGQGFLAETVSLWEAATEPAKQAGIRVVHLRSTVVLSRRGGLLGALLPLFRLGLGARLGSGRQYLSWISLPDEAGAIRFLLETADVGGPVNLAAPNPVTNEEFTQALAGSLGRPARLALPETPIRLAMGDQANEVAFISQRIVPEKLQRAGYSFQHPHIEEALEALLR